MKKFTLYHKVYISGIIVAALFAISFYYYFLPYYRDAIYKEKRLRLEELCSISVDIAKRYAYSCRENLLSDIEAQEKSLLIINDLRFGEERKNYFFIISGSGNVILHPYRPDLIGKNILSLRDPDGKYFIKEFVDISVHRKNGFSEYIWNKDDDLNNDSKKMTYVTTFEPWGWIIGAGMYVDDIEKEVYVMKTVFFQLLIISVIIVFVSILLIKRFLIQPINHVRQKIKNIKNSDMLIQYNDIYNFTEYIKKSDLNHHDIDIDFEILYISRLTRTMDGIIKSLMQTIEARDRYTSGHLHRVADLSVLIAKKLGLTNTEINCVRIAALLHDIGKIIIPAEILNKPIKLIDQEFGLIKRHSLKGSEILNCIDFPWPLSKIVLQHHERLDGSGYPDSLTGNAILIEAKIIGIADVVEAMSSHRPHRHACTKDDIKYELQTNRSIKYQAEIVDACLWIIDRDEFRIDHQRFS